MRKFGKMYTSLLIYAEDGDLRLPNKTLAEETKTCLS